MAPVPGHCLSSFHNNNNEKFRSFKSRENIHKKSLDPSRAEKIFIKKKLDHTAVSAIQASSVIL